MAPAPLLTLHGISKRYPAVLANDAVDLTVLPGQIHALLGENGAGKSTLVKIMYGVVKPDGGEIRWQGSPVDISSPNVARQLGIALVFQHFSLFESLTVTENIALGTGDKRPIDAIAADVAEVSERFGLTLDPDRHVHHLAIGERQRVEIVRCLLNDPKLLIMDEPTSVLTPQEADNLFVVLERLAADGTAILYISHKLEEVRQLCTKATILRGGRVVADVTPAEETVASLASTMVGEQVVIADRHASRPFGPPRLTVSGLSAAVTDPFGVPLRDVNFTVHAGEILGIAGVSGNGQNELLDALNGEMATPQGAQIRLDDVDLRTLNSRARRRAGLGFIPEERMGRGSVPEMSLFENAVLTGYDARAMASGGLIDYRKARQEAADIIGRFDVRAGGPGAAARSLSGGNLQKFITGREIMGAPKVLLASMPTWGVDAKAAAAIHKTLRELAEAGSAVLVVSQDLDELMAIADRMAVLFHGRLSEARPTRELTREVIGLLMGGAHPEAETLEIDPDPPPPTPDNQDQGVAGDQA